mgnify:CR=1 FL=1
MPCLGAVGDLKAPTDCTTLFLAVINRYKRRQGFRRSPILLLVGGAADDLMGGGMPVAHEMSMPSMAIAARSMPSSPSSLLSSSCSPGIDGARWAYARHHPASAV